MWLGRRKHYAPPELEINPTTRSINIWTAAAQHELLLEL
jgi:hypothetical protein